MKAMVFAVEADELRITLSVISKMMRSGLTPCRSIRLVRWFSMSAFRNCDGDKLIETSRLGNFAQSEKACSNTQEPSAGISPASSATGMNSDGAIGPSVGCVQRNSASTPVISLEAHENIG